MNSRLTTPTVVGLHSDLAEHRPLTSNIAVTIASRTCLIASDLLVIITTLVVTHSAVRLHGEGRIISHSFAGTLLRDGE